MRWSVRCAMGAVAVAVAFAALAEVAAWSDPSASALAAAGAKGWSRGGKKNQEKKAEVKPPEDTYLPIYARLATSLNLTDAQKRAFVQRVQARTAALAQFDKKYGTQLQVMREELAKAEKSQNESQISRLRPRVAVLEQARERLIQGWHQKILEAIPADQREQAEKAFTFGGGDEDPPAEKPKARKGAGKKGTGKKQKQKAGDDAGGDAGADDGGEG